MANQYGRAWDELDALKAQVWFGVRASALLADDDAPLAGLTVECQEPEMPKRGRATQ